jgi:hypothetical protein
MSNKSTNKRVPVELVWEAPPEPQPKLGMYGEVLREVEKHPGRWARVRLFEKKDSAYSALSSLRVRLARMDSRWESKVASIEDGQIGVYVRFRTDGQMAEARVEKRKL